jgi:hypothetical protein
MSACAGSSTERTPGQMVRTRTRRFTSCVPRKSPVHKRLSFKHFAGQVRMDRRPGRIGFMSTQRRENRWQRTICFACAGLSEKALRSPVARRECTGASGGTAPPGFPTCFHPSDETPSPGAPEWLATNSLQLGFRIVQLVLQDLRHGSPPFGAGSGEATSTPATHGIPLPHISFPSAPAPLRPTLPRVPAGACRWTERYDGKRDLYFQHAA